MNEKIIDYLYGEMSSSDKQLFEQELGKNPELRAEVDDFRSLQHLMRDVEDEPVVVNKVTIQPERKYPRLKPWMAVAAGLALLCTLFFALPIQIEKTGNQLMLTYGQHKAEVEENYINKTDFDLAIQNLKNDLIADLKPIPNNNAQLTSDVIQNELQQAFASWEQRQMKSNQVQLSDYSEIQSDRMHEFFTQLVRYIDEQREKDAEMYTQTLQEAVRRMELNTSVASNTSNNENL